MGRTVQFGEKKTEYLQLRITKEMKNDLKLVANSQNRNLTNFIDNLLIEKINEFKKEGKND